MRFATLIALAVFVSTTPSLAAPTPYPANPKRDTATDVDNIINTLIQNGTISVNVGTAITKLVNNTVPTVEHLLGHAINGTTANSTMKRAITSDIIQIIESAIDGLALTSKRDVITVALQSLLEEADPLLGNLKRDPASDDYQGLLQELESLGFSIKRHSAVEDRSFKLPEISPSTTSALENAANVATIGSGIAKVWEAVDGSSSSPSSKRESNTAIDERGFTIPASVTTWLKNLGNIASIGAGGAAIVGAVDGSSNSSILKRQAANDVDLAALLNGATSQFDARTAPEVSSSEVSGLESVLGKAAGVASAGGFVASLLSAFDGSSNSTKREWTAIDGIGPDSLPIVETIPQFDERGFTIPASVTTWLKNLGNVASIGAGAAAIAGAVDGSSNSTFLKREASDAADLTQLLNGATSQFDERGFTIPASVTTWLKNLGNVASIGAGAAAIAGTVDGSSNSTFLKREASDAIDLTQLLNGETSQFDERGFTIPASVTTWLKNLGNVASIGAGAAAIAGAVDGSSNSTFLKREVDQLSNGVDLAGLLDGVTPQFEDRSVSSGEVSGLESVLGKAAGVASAGGFIASLLSAFEGSSTSASSKRSTSDNGVSIPPDVLAMLQQIISQNQDTGINTQLASLD